MRANLATTIYTDPAGRFTVEYPEGWSITEGQSEVQFWNGLNTAPDFDPSIKMDLFSTSATTFDELKLALAEEETSFGATNEFSTVNGVPVMIRRGSFMSDYQIYYYDLDGAIVGFSAYYDFSKPDQESGVTQIQESFKKM